MQLICLLPPYTLFQVNRVMSYSSLEFNNKKFYEKSTLVTKLQAR